MSALPPKADIARLRDATTYGINTSGPGRVEALPNGNATLQQEDADLIDDAGALTDQPLPHAVERLQVELLGGLGRNELHRRTLHRLGECLGIAEVVSEACSIKFPALTTSGGITCFIVTATAGRQSMEVAILTAWREQFLRPYRLGRFIILLYELLSPPLARAVRQSEWVRTCVQRVIVGPAARWASTQLRERTFVARDIHRLD